MLCPPCLRLDTWALCTRMGNQQYHNPCLRVIICQSKHTHGRHHQTATNKRRYTSPDTQTHPTHNQEQRSRTILQIYASWRLAMGTTSEKLPNDPRGWYGSLKSTNYITNPNFMRLRRLEPTRSKSKLDSEPCCLATDQYEMPLN